MSAGAGQRSASERDGGAIWIGLAQGLGGMATMVVVLALAVELSGLELTLAEPTFETLAQLGAILLVAYSVEVAAAISRARARADVSASWLGLVVGVGASGLLGIAAAIGGAEWSRDVFEATTTGNSLAVASLALVGYLGVMVVIFPLLAWQRRGPDDAPGPGADG